MSAECPHNSPTKTCADNKKAAATEAATAENCLTMFYPNGGAPASRFDRITIALRGFLGDLRDGAEIENISDCLAVVLRARLGPVGLLTELLPRQGTKFRTVPRVFSNRLAAHQRYHGTAAPYFYRTAETLNLRTTEDDAERLIAAADEIEIVSGKPIRLLVIDTLNRAMAGGNENSPDDMGAFITQVEAVRRRLGCFALIIHHSGKDEARGMRGHSSLLGAVDTEITVADRTMTVTKQRDGEDGLAFGFNLETVELGRSPRGKLITSSVAVEAEAQASKPKLGPAQAKAIEALRQYVDDHGVPCPGGTGWPEAGTRRAVSVEAFLPFLADKMTADRATDRRKNARRTVDALVEKGAAQINEGQIWAV